MVQGAPPPLPSPPLPPALASELDKCVRAVSRGILTFEEFVNRCLVGIATESERGRSSLLGGEPARVHDEAVWDRALQYLHEQIDQQMHGDRPGPEDLEFLDAAVVYMRDRPARWWAVTQMLRRIRGLSQSPPERARATTLALDLLRDGTGGYPLEDRQVEDLARTLRLAGLDEALVAGWESVPFIPPGHGWHAWRDALVEVAGGVPAGPPPDTPDGSGPGVG